MIKLLRIIYSVYAGLLFIGSFLAIFPFFLICIWIPGWQRFGRKINRYWAKVYFTLIFLPVHMEKKCKLEKGKPYLFLANHFSYLDIAMMGFIPGDVQFVGKLLFSATILKNSTSQLTGQDLKAGLKL
jgi:1-acyl-sn-glycerol-3-phosphate acyltransferase